MLPEALRGISEKIGVGMTMANRITDPPIQLLATFALGIPALVTVLVLVTLKLGLLYAGLLVLRRAAGAQCPLPCLRTP